MKKYIDAQLEVVRVKKHDIITSSITRGTYDVDSGTNDAPDRFRDIE